MSNRKYTWFDYILDFVGVSPRGVDRDYEEWKRAREAQDAQMSDREFNKTNDILKQKEQHENTDNDKRPCDYSAWDDGL